MRAKPESKIPNNREQGRQWKGADTEMADQGTGLFSYEGFIFKTCFCCELIVQWHTAIPPRGSRNGADLESSRHCQSHSRWRHTLGRGHWTFESNLKTEQNFSNCPLTSCSFGPHQIGQSPREEKHSFLNVLQGAERKRLRWHGTKESGRNIECYIVP